MLYNILFEFIFGKTDIQNMFKHMSDLTNVKYTGEVDKINPNVHVYLFNHVSFIDFFMDNYIIGGNGCYISRVAVFFAVPLSCIYGFFNNCIYFIKRDSRIVKDNLKLGFENRIHKNKKLRVDSGVCFKVTEDFINRYENIALSGLQYEMFIIAIQKQKPNVSGVSSIDEIGS
jgi:hypothetical protein